MHGWVKKGTQFRLITGHQLVQRTFCLIGRNGAAQKTHGMNASRNKLENRRGPNPEEVPVGIHPAE